MRFPDAVSVRCGGEWFSLAGTNENWKFEELQVGFQLNGEMVSVSVSSPRRALEFIKCSWKQVFPASSKFLSDQWERSYGDLGWETAAQPVSAPSSQLPAPPQPIAATPTIPLLQKNHPGIS